MAEYIFTIARGSTAPPHDHGIVAVIDGKSIKITPFLTANIPPPIALHEIIVHANATDVSFDVDASRFVVLHQQGLSVYGWETSKGFSSPPSLNGRFTFEKTTSSSSIYQQICFSGKDEVLALGRTESGSIVQHYRFSDETGRMEERPSEADPIKSILNLSAFAEDGVMHPFVQGVSGDLHSLGFGDQSLSSTSFPSPLPWVEVVPHRDGLTGYGDGHIAFGMSSNGHLYANSRLLVKNCTSFLVTPAHLIFTTTTHLLKFVHITDVHGMPLSSLPTRQC